MASRKHGPIYTGVTSNLSKRVHDHKNQTSAGFTAKYRCKLLVYYEQHDTMESAIQREKQIKGGSRGRKVELIEKSNPNWRDLYCELF
jgi:putative endonuclease